MATQTIQSWAVTGETLTMRVYTVDSDTETASASATEATNRDGLYSANFTDLPADTYIVQLETAGGVVRSFYWVTTTAATATFQAYEVPYGALVGTGFDTNTDSLEAIRNRGDAAWSGGAGANPALLQTTTIATLATQTSFTLTDGSSDDDAYTSMVAVFTDAVTNEQKSAVAIDDYVGSTKTVTLLNAPAFVIAPGDTVSIIADISLKPSDNLDYHFDASEIAAISSQVTLNGTQIGSIISLIGTLRNLGSGATVGDNLYDMAGATFDSSTDSLDLILEAILNISAGGGGGIGGFGTPGFPLGDLENMSPTDLLAALGPKRVKNGKDGSTETEAYDLDDVVKFLDFTRKRTKKTSSAMQRIGKARMNSPESDGSQ